MGRLQAGFLWIALADSGAFLSVNHIPPLPIPHGLEYPLGSRMHLVVVHPRLEARGRIFPRSPWSRSRVALRVLRPLTRGSQGQPSPLRTPHGRPGVQGIFPTSRGQVPHGWPMVHHSMATGFPIPRGCCLALSASLPFPCPILLCLWWMAVFLHLLSSPEVWILDSLCPDPAQRQQRGTVLWDLLKRHWQVHNQHQPWPFSTDPNLKKFHCVHQPDGWSCAVFACCGAEWVVSLVLGGSEVDLSPLLLQLSDLDLRNILRNWHRTVRLLHTDVVP